MDLFLIEDQRKTVSIGIKFDRIGEIDIMHERFYAELLIIAKWKSNTSIENYDPEIDWNPELFIENNISELQKTVSYKVVCDDDNQSTSIIETHVYKGHFWERIKLHNFPLDVQALNVTVCTAKSSTEITLVQSAKDMWINRNVFDTFVDQQKWNLYKFLDVFEYAQNNISVNKKFSEIDIERQKYTSKVRATCYVSRYPQYYLWNAYFLVFLITAMSLNTFSIDAKLPQGRIQASVVLLLTSVSFKWVTNQNVPAISYSTSLDVYSLANMFLLCLVCVWHGFIATIDEHKTAKQIENWALLAFCAYFLLLHLHMLLWYIVARRKIRNLKAKEARFLESRHINSSIYKRNYSFRKTKTLLSAN